MKMLKGYIAGTTLLAAGLVSPHVQAQGQGQSLPEGAGRDKMLVACTACHGLENITNPHKKLTAEEWEYYFYDMIARGANVQPGDMELVKNYLINSFAVDR
jgi:hypothetical protein